MEILYSIWLFVQAARADEIARRERNRPQEDQRTPRTEPLPHIEFVLFFLRGCQREVIVREAMDVFYESIAWFERTRLPGKRIGSNIVYSCQILLIAGAFVLSRSWAWIVGLLVARKIIGGG